MKLDYEYNTKERRHEFVLTGLSDTGLKSTATFIKDEPHSINVTEMVDRINMMLTVAEKHNVT